MRDKPRKAKNMSDAANRNNWATPQDFFDLLDQEFAFTLDAAASPENAKCDQFFTEADDGLETAWIGNRVFCNPPYGQKGRNGCAGIGAWLDKAFAETAGGYGGYCDCAVVLTPCDPSTDWFGHFARLANEVRLCNPRVQFVPPAGVKASSAPSTTAVWVFQANDYVRSKGVDVWFWKRAIERLAGEV